MRPTSNSRTRTALALVAAVLIWSALSYAMISMFAGGGVCSILRTVTPGVTQQPLTQAEMDAMTARCNRPNAGTLGIALVGYIAIVGIGVAQLSKPQRTNDLGPAQS